MASATRNPLGRWLLALLLSMTVVLSGCTDGDGAADGGDGRDNGTEPSRGVQGQANGTAAGTATARAGGDAERMALAANIGSSVDQSYLATIDIDVMADGTGLPEGRGTVQEGQQLYTAQCAACHGVDGRAPSGSIGPALVSEPGPWEPGMPKTIGSYWPYATTVYDYIRRAMPFNEPGTLTDDQVYAVTAYLLNQNQIVPDDAVMTQESLPDVEMPNRDNFEACWPDQCRPDVGR